MRRLTTVAAAMSAAILLTGIAQALTPADKCEADKRWSRRRPRCAGHRHICPAMHSAASGTVQMTLQSTRGTCG